MVNYDVTIIALNIRKWDLESQRLSLTTYFVMDDEEKSHLFELSITQPPEMVEEFLGKIQMACKQKMKHVEENPEEISINLSNETFLRQKLYNYFKRILGELNNPKRKKGQSKMIFTTHMDVFNENQDISFLPVIIQFFVVLNYARKYYDKEDYQRAVDPLRKLIKIKPDFGLGYKWLARSLKKIRKYEDAMRYYEKYAEVDDSLDAWLDLAKSFRKGKIFDRSEEIYKKVLKENPEEKEAKIGMAQIKYARKDEDYLSTLEELHNEDAEWMKTWMKEEFNFRIYSTPKTPITPIQAAHYLGFNQVFELTQRAFKNEVPSHFNPGRARMSFYKEELDNWAMVMNRFGVLPEEVVLHPDQINVDELKPVEIVEEEVESDDYEQKPAETIPKKRSTKVEEILRQIRESKARRAAIKDASARSQEDVQAKPKRRRGRPPKEKSDAESAPAPEAGEEKTTRRRGRPPLSEKKEPATTETGKPKRKRGRPPKNASAANADKNTQSNDEEQPKKRKRGRPKKKVNSENDISG